MDARCSRRVLRPAAAAAASTHAPSAVDAASAGSEAFDGGGPRSHLPHASGRGESRWRLVTGTAPAACARSNEPTSTAVGSPTGSSSSAHPRSTSVKSSPKSSGTTETPTAAAAAAQPGSSGREPQPTTVSLAFGRFWRSAGHAAMSGASPAAGGCV